MDEAPNINDGDGDGADEGQKQKKENKGKAPAHRQKHGHAGGSGAVLGAQLARYIGWQGGSLLASNLLHLASIVYVARRLGASDLGTYSLLLFWSGLITQVFHIFSKPGTLRRTFGQADDEDAGDEGDFDTSNDDDVVSDTPQKSLGTGIVWVTLLGILGAALTIIFRGPIAEVVLGDRSQAVLILWAGVLGGVGGIFRLCDIVIWFERRPLTFVIVDASRPLFNIILMAWFISKGMGVRGAIMGAALGTSAASLLSVLALVRSFEFTFSWAETWLIVKRGFGRIPIAMSTWTVTNADTFILSRYVDHQHIGYYNLAQKLGLVVAFLPQGFRVALRPLRKSASFQAVTDQYGSAIARGQLLSYFCLSAIIAILSMELAGQLIINQASSRFQAAEPIIPLTAASMSMVPLFRTICGSAAIPHKRRWFILSTVWAGFTFVGWMMLLVPRLGIAGAPLGVMLGFGIPCVFMFVRTQRGEEPINFPYLGMGRAIAMAVAIALGFHYLHPANKWVQLSLIVALMIIYITLLFVTRVIPVVHRAALLHIARSAFRKSPHGFERERALRGLKPRQLSKLRAAIVDRIPLHELERSARSRPQNGSGSDAEAVAGADGLSQAADGNGDGHLAPKEAERLVHLLRKVGQKGGLPVGEHTELDGRIAKFLFADIPVAARIASMRGLVAAGADSNDLRALEELKDYLAKSPSWIWETEGERGLRLRLPVKNA